MPRWVRCATAIFSIGAIGEFFFRCHRCRVRRRGNRDRLYGADGASERYRAGGCGAGLFFQRAFTDGTQHFAPKLARSLLSKELLVGVLFTAGCMLPSWPRIHSAGATLWPFWIPGVYFAALAWLNCSCIAHWESADTLPTRASFHRGRSHRRAFVSRISGPAGRLLAILAFHSHSRGRTAGHRRLERIVAGAARSRTHAPFAAGASRLCRSGFAHLSPDQWIADECSRFLDSFLDP